MHIGIPFLQSIIDSENINGLNFVNKFWVNYLIRDNISLCHTEG